MEARTGIPKEMLGTNIPSITSKWMYCAPASSVILSCSPRHLKSPESMDGAKILFIL